MIARLLLSVLALWAVNVCGAEVVKKKDLGLYPKAQALYDSMHPHVKRSDSLYGKKPEDVSKEPRTGYWFLYFSKDGKDFVYFGGELSQNMSLSSNGQFVLIDSVTGRRKFALTSLTAGMVYQINDAGLAAFVLPVTVMSSDIIWVKV